MPWWALREIERQALLIIRKTHIYESLLNFNVELTVKKLFCISDNILAFMTTKIIMVFCNWTKITETAKLLNENTYLLSLDYTVNNSNA